MYILYLQVDNAVMQYREEILRKTNIENGLREEIQHLTAQLRHTEQKYERLKKEYNGFVKDILVFGQRKRRMFSRMHDNGTTADADNDMDDENAMYDDGDAKAQSEAHYVDLTDDAPNEHMHDTLDPNGELFCEDSDSEFIVNDNQLECVNCKMIFDDDDALKQHQCVHVWAENLHEAMPGTGIVYKCTWNLCGQTFTDAQEYEVHRASHERTRKFGCNVCGKKYTDFSNLRRHQKIHRRIPAVKLTTIKDTKMSKQKTLKHECSKCGRNYCSARSLRRHAIVHDRKSNDDGDDKQFECTICGNKYKWKSSMLKHFRRNHK